MNKNTRGTAGRALFWVAVLGIAAAAFSLVKGATDLAGVQKRVEAHEREADRRAQRILTKPIDGER